jgi:hypothetical protein
VLDRRFSMKKLFLSSTRGASFHTKQASNVNDVRVVLVDANSYLAYSSKIFPCLVINYRSYIYQVQVRLGEKYLYYTFIYAQEMGKIAEDPKGAALTEPKLCAASPKSANGFTTGCDGKNGAKCAFL